MAYDLSPYLPPDQQMNASSLMPPQGMQPMPFSMQQPIPQQQTDPNAGLLKDIFNQYVQTQKAPSQDGIIQQILANRLQPTMDDTARSVTQTAQAYGAPDLFKAATPEAIMNQRYAGELGPYESILGLQTKAADLKNRGGATGELIDRLMQDNPGMSFQDALYRVQTGYRQGQTIDAQGNVINMPGAVDAAANMSGAKKAAQEGATLQYAAPIAAATAQGQVAGKGEITPMQTLNKGQNQVSDIIGNMNGYYDQLDQGGAAVNSNNGSLKNAMNYLGNTNAGQLAGKMFGTQIQQIRNNIEQARPLLINAIRQATGMSAKAMDSNAELKFYLQAATDPTIDVNSNRVALQKLDQLYGLSSKKLMNGNDSPAVSPVADPLGIR